MAPKKPAAAEKASALEKKLKAIKKLKKKAVSDRSARDKEKDRLEDFKCHIIRVLEQVHPGLGISDPAMNMINGFIYGIFEKLVAESARLLRCSENPLRISSNHIKDALKLVLPPCELVNRAMWNGAKAVSNDYKNYNLIMSSDFMSRFDGLGL